MFARGFLAAVRINRLADIKGGSRDAVAVNWKYAQYDYGWPIPSSSPSLYTTQISFCFIPSKQLYFFL